MIILEEKLSKIFKEIFASHLRATIKAEDTVILARAFICGATKQPREWAGVVAKLRIGYE